MSFSNELRIKQLEANVGSLNKQITKLAQAFDARTRDLARAHNGLVALVRRGGNNASVDSDVASAKQESTSE